MTINPETEIVASSWDPQTRAHSYTIERTGRRWTVVIPDDDLQRFGPVLGASAAVNKQNRRRHLAAVLENAMRGEPDD